MFWDYIKQDNGEKNSTENLAAVRHVALNLLKKLDFLNVSYGREV